jgi:hypothetical protein
LAKLAPRHLVERGSDFYKNMPRAIIALVFRCEASGGSLKVSDEVTRSSRYLREYAVPASRVQSLRMFSAKSAQISARCTIR